MYLWRFFKKPDTPEEDIPMSVTSTDKYPLYAITNQKLFAQRFKSERNMNKFISMKTEVDKEEYIEYASLSRGCVLELHKLTTVKNKYKKDQVLFDVEVLITNQEYQLCVEPSFNLTDEYWWSTYAISPYIFNKKIMKALKNLDYGIAYKLFNYDGELISTDIDLSIKKSLGFNENDDYCGPSWEIDILNYFISIYGETFKID